MNAEERKKLAEAAAERWATLRVNIHSDTERQKLEAVLRLFEAYGFEPIPDAVEQLMEAFMPALKIMVERGYDPKGKTWRDNGWRGLVLEIDKKNGRLLHRSWSHSVFDHDILDMMNYAGMYYRMHCEGPPFGAKGEPAPVGTELPPISLGDYTEMDK